MIDAGGVIIVVQIIWQVINFIRKAFESLWLCIRIIRLILLWLVYARQKAAKSNRRGNTASFPSNLGTPVCLGLCEVDCGFQCLDFPPIFLWLVL